MQNQPSKCRTVIMYHFTFYFNLLPNYFSLYWEASDANDLKKTYKYYIEVEIHYHLNLMNILCM